MDGKAEQGNIGQEREESTLSRMLDARRQAWRLAVKGEKIDRGQVTSPWKGNGVPSRVLRSIENADLALYNNVLRFPLLASRKFSDAIVDRLGRQKPPPPSAS